MDYLKASIVISTSCSVAIVGIAAYTAKQSRVLNQTIADGVSLMRENVAFRQENPPMKPPVR